MVSITLMGSTVNVEESEPEFDPLTLDPAMWLTSTYGLYQERTGASATTAAEEDGDPVGTWAYRYGTAGTLGYLTASSNAARSTLKLAVQNGLPVVRFDGVDDYLNASFALEQPYIRFCVARYLTTGTKLILDGATGNTAYLYDAAGAGTAWDVYAGATLSRTGSTAAWTISEAVFDGATSEFAINGGAAATGNVGSSDPDGVSVGAGPNGDFPAHCDVAEVLVFPGALSPSERTQVRNYLNDKWGVY